MSAGGDFMAMSRERWDELCRQNAEFHHSYVMIAQQNWLGPYSNLPPADAHDPTGRPPIDYSQITREMSD